MRRQYTSILLGAAALAGLGGCAYQDPLALPDLGPPTRSSQQYPGYSPYSGYGSAYGYGNGYRPGYDPYYYGGGYPQYYSPGVVYVPYPVPCVDGNRDGRCDKRPPKDRDNDGNGQHHGNQNGDRNAVPPRYQRDRQQHPGDGPRVQRDVTTRDGAAVQPSPRGPVPAQSSPAQLRPPPPPPRRVAPAPQAERQPRPGPRQRPAGDDRPAQEP